MMNEPANNKMNRLDEGDMVAYIDGVASDDVITIIESDPSLLNEIAAMRALDNVIGASLSADFYDQLALFAGGLLSDADARQVEARIAANPQLQAHVQRLRNVAIVETDAPAATVWQQIVASGKRLLDMVAVTRDAPAVALRGETAIELTFEMGRYTVSITKTPPIVAESVWQIEGQLVETESAEPAVGTVHLVNAADSTILSDKVDAFGYFQFAEIAPARYSLLFELDAAAARLDDFVIP